MAFIFRFGSIDLSPYVRVSPGEGMDPYSTEFIEPAFVDSPFSEGERVSSVNVKNREQAWPLFLKGRDKRELHTLVGQLNREFDKNTVTLIEWRDDGATDSTYYTVEFARFEPDYNFRRGQVGYLGGVLRAWVSFGHTGTAKLYASASSQPQMIQTLVPTQLEGDYAGKFDVKITVGSSVPERGRFIAFGVAPASYKYFYTPSDMTVDSNIAVTGRRTASYAIDPYIQDFAPSLFGGPAITYIPAPAPSIHPGPHRVLALVELATLQSLAMTAQDAAGNYLGATALATSHQGYQVIDLGVLRPALTNPSPIITLKAEKFTGGWQEIAGNNDAAPKSALAGIVYFPENESTFIVDEDVTAVAGYTADQFAGVASAMLQSYTDGLGNPITATTLAVIGGSALMVSGSGVASSVPQIAAYSMLPGWARFNQRIQHPPISDFSAQVRFDVGASPGPSTMVGIAKSTASSFVSFEAQPSVNRSVALKLLGCEYIGAASSIVLATAAVGASMFGSGSNVFPIEMTLNVRGNAAWGELVCDSQTTPGAFASLGVVGSTGISAFYGAGRTDVYGVATMPPPSSATFTYPVEIANVRVSRVASVGAGARDIYHFDGVNGRIIRRNAASAFVADLTGSARGKMPMASALTQTKVGILAVSTDQGSLKDAMDVTISVRERFVFMR